jgi:urease accessory protein
VLARLFAKSPVKLFATHHRQHGCAVYAATLGGGLVGGDQVCVVAEVDTGARALLTTQASTKVYRSLRPASQTLTARIEADGFLAVVPDPVVCFAGADFTQRQRYDLRGDASLVLVDWLTSGRHAAGERWAFVRYESRIDVRRAGNPVLFDGIVLERGLDSVASRMGRFEVLATVVLTGPLVIDAISRIWADTSSLPVMARAESVISVARLSDGGLLLRMAGVNLEEVACTLRSHLGFLSRLVGDDFWSRKW